MRNEKPDFNFAISFQPSALRIQAGRNRFFLSAKGYGETGEWGQRNYFIALSKLLCQKRPRRR
jgi:hypothetical protein